MGLVDVVIAYTFIKNLSTSFTKTKQFDVGIIDKDGKFLVQYSQATSEQKKYWPNKLTVIAWNIKKLLSKVGIGKSTVGSFASALYLLKEQIQKENILNVYPEKDLIEMLENTIYNNNRERLINEAFESSIFPSTLERGQYKVLDESLVITKDTKPFTYSMGVALYEAFSNSGKKVVFSKSDIEEEVPANNVGGGMIKGIAPGEDPPIRVKKKKKIYELMGRYTVFEVSPEEFERCTCAKRKFEKWNKFFDEDSETGSEIKKYSYHNPHKGIILRNSETGQTMMFRRRWNDQRLTHNRKTKLLVQSQNKAFSIWTH